MTLQIRPLSASHFSRSTQLTRQAMQSSANTMALLGPVTPAQIAYFTAHDLAAYEARTDDDYWLGIFDSSSTEELIAVAHWTLDRAPKSPEAADGGTDSKQEHPPGANVGAMKEFWADLERVKAEVMASRTGRYWYLTGLATDPSHQRRGAGKMLLNWGLERADREGRECFLIGNRGSRGLYEKVGFAVARKCEWDGDKWGAREGWGNWAMIRTPRVKDE